MKNINILNRIKKELNNLTSFELALYIASFLIIGIFTFLAKNNIIAAISALFGITYTILAGRGKIYCYFFGIMSSLLYSYLAFKNGLYGNFLLNFCYYLPMQIIGIFLWKKNLKENSLEIIKTKLKLKAGILFFVVSALLAFIFGLVMKNYGNLPFFDGICFVFSISAMILTVKRCIEQWYFWTIVNFTSVLMWTIICLNGSNYYATVLMWLNYLILGLYFLKKWKKEVKN